MTKIKKEKIKLITDEDLTELEKDLKLYLKEKEGETELEKNLRREVTKELISQYKEMLKISTDYYSNIESGVRTGFLKEKTDNIQEALKQYSLYINEEIKKIVDIGDYEQVRDLSNLFLEKPTIVYTPLKRDNYLMIMNKDQRIITVKHAKNMEEIISKPFSRVYFNLALKGAEKMISNVKQGKIEEAGYITPYDFPELVERKNKGVYDNLKFGFQLALVKRIKEINDQVSSVSKGRLNRLFERGAHGKTAYKLITKNIEIN